MLKLKSSNIIVRHWFWRRQYTSVTTTHNTNSLLCQSLFECVMKTLIHYFLRVFLYLSVPIGKDIQMPEWRIAIPFTADIQENRSMSRLIPKQLIIPVSDLESPLIFIIEPINFCVKPFLTSRHLFTYQQLFVYLILCQLQGIVPFQIEGGNDG